MLKNAKLKTKIIWLVSGLIFTISVIYLLVIWEQSTSVKRTLLAEFRATAEKETTITARDIYHLCCTYNDALNNKIDGILKVLAIDVKKEGGLSQSTSGTVAWTAVNQFSQESVKVKLPKMLLGNHWLGQQTSFEVKLPVVDEISDAMGVTCTIFQRMNEQGDLLRVASTVKTSHGLRAVGTFIPAVEPGGQVNKIVAAIKSGNSYQGLAKVVDKWCTTAYQPLFDSHGRVIGALFVGINQDLNTDLVNALKAITVGKTGYAFVIGARGDRRGQVIIHKTLPFGYGIFQSADPALQKVMDSLLQTAVANGDGKPAFSRYDWQNAGESKPRAKVASVIYFAPFEWMIGAGAYEDDFLDAEKAISSSFVGMLMIIVITSLVVLVAGWGICWWFAASISLPLVRAVNIAQAVAKGDFSQRMNLDSTDEIGVLGQALDMVPTRLSQIEEQFNHLAEAAENGNMKFRGEADQFDGAYRQIIEIVNRTLDNITGPIRSSLLVLDRLQVNDITQTVDVAGLKGDYRKIADSVNNVQRSMAHLQATAIRIAAGELGDLAEYEKIGRRSNNDQLVPAFTTMLKAITMLVQDTEMLAQAGQAGKLAVRADAARHQGAYRDIVNGINRTLDAVVNPLNAAADVLRAAAGKDLTQHVEIDCQGDFQELKNSINELVDSMSLALYQVAEAIQQVNSGGQQIADASQSLSQGATEQAASLEQISSSMTEIGHQVTSNAENANQASRVSSEARTAAETGVQNMESMVTSMRDINQSSQLIAKVNKVIDDIAFQTNLLALNAAVEAARAGTHGKGFAVVAGEVRSLAGRSADAAKETAQIIDESLKKVERGLAVAEKTHADFNQIVSGIVKVSDLSADIATASNEQAEGITQITQGLNQIDQVTQQNTAHAEETAAASEELSGQANQLQQLIGQFQLPKQNR